MTHHGTRDDAVAELRGLYSEIGKHAGYQLLARRLRDRLGDPELPVRSRHEPERLRFLREHLDPRGRTVLDIGANTGFFSLELVDLGAARVDCFEGNPTHARFVRRAAELLGCAHRLRVHPVYWDFDRQPAGSPYDIGLLLNVLHHLGADFGDPEISIDAARDGILVGLNRLAPAVRTLALQIGYCWKGDRNLPLFRHGTKQEQIDFIRSGIAGAWEVAAIGIAWPADGAIIYREPDPVNLARRDDLGEFLNRPLFILHSVRA